MADETPIEPKIDGRGRPRVNIAHLEVAKIIELMTAGMPRALACKEVGWKSYRNFQHLMAEDEDFRDQIRLIEMSREGLGELNIYSAMVKGGDDDPEASERYLNLRWKIQAMKEGRRCKRRAEKIEDKKLAQEELKAAIAAGTANTAMKFDLAGFSPEDLAVFLKLLERATLKPDKDH